MTEQTLLAYQHAFNSPEGEAVIRDISAYLTSLELTQRGGAALILTRIIRLKDPSVLHVVKQAEAKKGHKTNGRKRFTQSTES